MAPCVALAKGHGRTSAAAGEHDDMILMIMHTIERVSCIQTCPVACLHKLPLRFVLTSARAGRGSQRLGGIAKRTSPRGEANHGLVPNHVQSFVLTTPLMQRSDSLAYISPETLAYTTCLSSLAKVTPTATSLLASNRSRPLNWSLCPRGHWGVCFR